MLPAADPARQRRLVAVFSALGDETRLGLVSHLLAGRPQSISRLAAGTNLTRQAVTKHLGVLQTAGLIDKRRDGRESRYYLKPDAIDDARRYLERASAQWDDAIARLQAHLE